MERHTDAPTCMDPSFPDIRHLHEWYLRDSSPTVGLMNTDNFLPVDSRVHGYLALQLPLISSGIRPCDLYSTRVRGFVGKRGRLSRGRRGGQCGCVVGVESRTRERSKGSIRFRFPCKDGRKEGLTTRGHVGSCFRDPTWTSAPRSRRES